MTTSEKVAEIKKLVDAYKPYEAPPDDWEYLYDATAQDAYSRGCDDGECYLADQIKAILAQG